MNSNRFPRRARGDVFGALNAECAFKAAMVDVPKHIRIIQTVRCPVCRALTRYDAASSYRPFCSERCRLIDLGQWLAGDYRVAGEPVAPEPSEDE